MTRVQNALSFLEAREHDHLEQLFELLRIESVSADPSRASQVSDAASWIADKLKAIGVSDVQILTTDLHPVVLGSVDASPTAPTVLLYGHFDVQPEDPIDEWITPPFEPDIRDGALFARGSADDKGQLFMHIRAVEALLATGDLPVNVLFVLEGEEEIGSSSLVTLLDSHRESLRADLAIVSDSPMFDDGVPSVGYGLRGLCYLEVRLRGPDHDLHSGQFGGAVVNPATVLVNILDQLHNEDGSVNVPGFYDDVVKVETDERMAISELPFNEHQLLDQVGAPSLGGEQGYSTLERTWIRPTLEINGLTSGYQGPGAKTIVPARASAKLSCRLVPNQDYGVIATAVQEAVKSLTPPTIVVDVEFIHGAQPWWTSPTTPAFEIARTSLRESFGVDAVYARDGGSIPVVPQLANSLGVDTMLLGFGVPSENKHAPNEHLLMSNYANGTEALVRLLVELGEIGNINAR